MGWTRAASKMAATARAAPPAGAVVSRRTFVAATATAAITLGTAPLRGLLAVAGAHHKPVFHAASPPPAMEGRPYRYRFVATGTPRYRLVAGHLPPHMTLHPRTGELTGIPRTVGTVRFRVRATNGAGSATTRRLEIHTSDYRVTKPVNRQRPVISNLTPSVGQTISVTPGSWEV